MIISWFDTRDTVAFAEEIVLELNELLSLMNKTGKQHAGKKEQKRFDMSMSRVKKYASVNSLNVYKKAKFLNVIKWRLRDFGYDEDLISEMIEILTKALNY